LGLDPPARYHGHGPPGHDGSPALDDPLNPIPASDRPPAPGVDAAAPGEPAPPESHPPAAAADPATAPPTPPGAPGLREQVGATRDSIRRLVGAHVELAKAELGDIADAAKRAAALVGIAVAAGIVAGLLIVVGMPLFLGEAIFGSMGWGILLGLLLLAALALAAAVAALRPGVQASIGRPFILGLVVGVIVGVVLGLDLTNRAWSTLADQVAGTIDPSYRPLLVAVGGLAAVGAVLGLIAGGVLGGGGGAVAGLVGGAIAGVLLGFLTAFAPGRRVGAAIGVAAGLITWISLLGAGVARGGFDTDAIKDRFWPARTIEATKETIEWARERMPLSRKS
jgi:hypothetical protein